MKVSRLSSTFRLLTTASVVLSAAACASTPAAPFDAGGVYVQHVRVRIVPSHTQAFEALVARCIEAAQAADLACEYTWLCYREPPGRYWLLWFSEERDAFAIPDAPDALVGLVRHVARAAGEDALADVDRRLAQLDYELEWNVVSRQKTGWSTVDSMSTATHPKARMMVRTIRPGAEAAFDRALTARTAFLRDHGYSLPVEGFAVIAGAPGTAIQVVFPVDWPSFHAADSFSAFVGGLDETAQRAYAQRKQALMVTMDRAEFYDGAVAPELCYTPN